MNVNSNTADRTNSESSWIKPTDNKGIQWTLGRDGTYTGTQKVKVTLSDDREYSYSIRLSNISNPTEGEKLFNSKIAEILKIAIDCGITPQSKKSLEYSNETYIKINANGEKREVKPGESIERRQSKIEQYNEELKTLDSESQSAKIENLTNKIATIQKKIETERTLTKLLLKNENSASQESINTKNEIIQPSSSQEQKKEVVPSTSSIQIQENTPTSSEEIRQSEINLKRIELQLLMNEEKFTPPESGAIRLIVLKNKKISEQISIFSDGKKEKILKFLENKCQDFLSEEQKNIINSLLHPIDQNLEDIELKQTPNIESPETTQQQKTYAAISKLNMPKPTENIINPSIDYLNNSFRQAIEFFKLKEKNKTIIQNLSEELGKKTGFLNRFRKSKIDKQTKMRELKELKISNDKLSLLLETETNLFDDMLNRLIKKTKSEINTSLPEVEIPPSSMATCELLLEEFCKKSDLSKKNSTHESDQIVGIKPEEVNTLARTAEEQKSFMGQTDELYNQLEKLSVKPNQKLLVDNYIEKLKKANEIFRKNELRLEEILSDSSQSDPNKLISKIDTLCGHILSDDFSDYLNALYDLTLSLEENWIFPNFHKTLSPGIYVQRATRILMILEEIAKILKEVKIPVLKIDLAILKVKFQLNKMNNKL